MSAPKTKRSKQSFFPTDPVHAAERADTFQSRRKTPPRLEAQTPAQKVFLKKLNNWFHDILFATGPAGTGKTYMATRKAIEAFLAGEFDKMVITRPNVDSGDPIGFLPGTLFEKMAPWTRPIVDVFMEYFSPQEFKRMLESEEVEIAPLAFMRGRTFKHSVILVDEAQNCTPDQMKMVLTRIGEGSKMIVTGDVEQYDRPKVGTRSGLSDIVRRIHARHAAKSVLPGFITAGYANDEEPARAERIGLVEFTKVDVVRHEVVAEVLDMYDEAA